MTALFKKHFSQYWASLTQDQKLILFGMLIGYFLVFLTYPFNGGDSVFLFPIFPTLFCIFQSFSQKPVQWSQSPKTRYNLFTLSAFVSVILSILCFDSFPFMTLIMLFSSIFLSLFFLKIPLVRVLGMPKSKYRPVSSSSQDQYWNNTSTNSIYSSMPGNIHYHWGSRF